MSIGDESCPSKSSKKFPPVEAVDIMSSRECVLRFTVLILKPPVLNPFESLTRKVATKALINKLLRFTIFTSKVCVGDNKVECGINKNSCKLSRNE